MTSGVSGISKTNGELGLRLWCTKSKNNIVGEGHNSRHNSKQLDKMYCSVEFESQNFVSKINTQCYRHPVLKIFPIELPLPSPRKFTNISLSLTSLKRHLPHHFPPSPVSSTPPTRREREVITVWERYTGEVYLIKLEGASYRRSPPQPVVCVTDFRSSHS